MEIVFTLPWLILLSIPLAMTVWNIYSFVMFLEFGKDGIWPRVLEFIFAGVGVIYVWLYTDVLNVVSAEWYEQLHNQEKHSFVSLERLPTLCILVGVAVLGYAVLRYTPTEKLPPLLAAFGVAGVYIGVGLCIMFCIQLPDFWVILFFGNCVLILIKTICIVVKCRNEQIKSGEHCTKFKRLSEFLDNWVSLPVLGFLALLPLMGIVFAIMTLFGQTPSDVIKIWTETADWTLSQKIPPQNIYYDEHYLCTVAAGGHRRVVRPLRTGMRRGHRVVVNRQLCIANAFEDVIQTRTPRFHKFVRTVYDNLGYPIAKHIRSKYAADVIYYLMKPLEWIFLLVLYATCSRPEDRIAVQYPHRAPPKIN